MIPTRLIDQESSLGEAVPSAGNRPIALDDLSVAWLVEKGALDVFLIERQDGEIVASSRHLLRAGPGRLAFGMAGSDASLSMTARGLPGTELRRVDLEVLLSQGLSDDLCDQVDAWVEEFSAAVALQVEPRPRPSLLISSGESLDVAAPSVLATRPDRVVWAAAEGASADYLGTEEPDQGSTGLVPLTSETWLSIQSPVRVTGYSSRDLIGQGRLLTALADFHRLVIGAEQLNRLLSLADEANEQMARAAHRHMDREHARRGLFSVLGAPRSPAQEVGDPDPLQGALQLIGRREGIAFQAAQPTRASGNEEPLLQDILTASGVRGRKVRLMPEDRWWLGDSGGMLAFRRDDGQPVALLPSAFGTYSAVDPGTGRRTRLNAERASEIDPAAWFFYRPFPEDRPVQPRDILRLAGKGMAADLGRFIAAGLLASLLMLAPAIAVGIVADQVTPSMSGGLLVQTVIALVLFAVLGALMLMLQGTALMRLEGRAAARISAALWDHALRLPHGFFRRFTAGELAVRLSTFQTLRDQLSGVVANALLSLVFLLPTLAVLFIYDAALAWVSLGMALLSLTVTCVLGLLQIRPQRRRYAVSRRLAGDLFQFVNGMGKLRSAGAEESAFASWARGYREQHLAGIRIGRLNEHLIAFNSAAMGLGVALLFGVALWGGADRLAVGDFLIVYAVSMTLYTAVAGFGRSFEAIAAVIPAYEQVKPALVEQPELRTGGITPPELSGDIHLDHVSFRYTEDGPLILNDVSIHARHGEFVAIVGESGSGKSTLIRLALGLEDPALGSIYYDGRDLSRLNLSSVRRQCGVVLQNGALRPGNILDNIIGVGNDLTIEDAWRAAGLAHVDEDIEAMPMDMFTIVGDGAATFSGGQIQRIKLAAALVRNPRILFLDEATSWLDARSQAEVMLGIESLAATRIVIAHRLSTIRMAERIYVIQAGRVVQQGNFDELFNIEGMFRDLAQRQVT